jgi:hypothetical protein
MPFLTKYKNDVFISYAHLDNEPTLLVNGKQCGWIDVLVEKLARELRQRLGSKQVKVYLDDNDVAGNYPLTPQLIEAVRSSALLLMIVSPGYLGSEWCKRERDTFLTDVRDRVAQGSVFALFARAVGREQLPSEFRDLPGFDLFTLDPEAKTDRPLGALDPYEPEFVTKIYNVSHNLQEKLLQMQAERPPVAAAAPGATTGEKPCVFLARSTEDLEAREEEVRNYLEQAGIEVLPHARYPHDQIEAFTAAMERDLGRCRVFAQLLSALRGELELAPGKRLPWLQSAIATHASATRLLWRERSLDLNSVRDSQQRDLLEGARACGIEEFKRAVLDEARKKPAEPVNRSDQAVVFVNADASDRQLATAVGEMLQGLGVDYFLPLDQGKPEAIREDYETNIKECDGLLLVYGTAGAEWIRSQLLFGRRIMGKRERPLAALAVLEGPPPDKPDLAFAVANLKKLNCRGGVDGAVLQGFAQLVRR